MKKILAELKDLTVEIDGNQILNHVNFQLCEGDVCALVGKNAAGKTLLMRVLAGLWKEYTGSIVLPSHREKKLAGRWSGAGVYLLQQKRMLVDSLSVEENLFIGCELTRKFGLLHRQRQHEEAEKVLAQLHLDGIELQEMVSNISTANKILVELAKAMVMGTKVLLFDTTLADTSDSERAAIFQVLLEFAKLGCAVVFVSQRVDDVLRICNRGVVLDGGCVIEDFPIDHATTVDPVKREVLIQKIAGAPQKYVYPKTKNSLGPVILKASKVSSVDNYVQDISLYIRKGEVVGIASTNGMEKRHLAQTLAGLEKIQSGYVECKGRVLSRRENCSFFQNGVLLLSSLLQENLVDTMNLEKNLTLASIPMHRFGVFVNKLGCFLRAKNLIDRYNLRNASPLGPVAHLSAGTQQKVAIAKLMNANPSVLILDEPTEYLDTASKIELYNLINAFSIKGVAVILLSSDISELVGMCDRIYALKAGKTMAEFAAPGVSVSDVLAVVS